MAAPERPLVGGRFGPSPYSAATAGLSKLNAASSWDDDATGTDGIEEDEPMCGFKSRLVAIPGGGWFISGDRASLLIIDSIVTDAARAAALATKGRDIIMEQVKGTVAIVFADDGAGTVS